MATLVMEPFLEDRLKTERAESGADRYDEVWEGVYVMPPMPNEEHQQLVTRMGAVLQLAVGWDGPDKVYAGINVSDREDDWEHNYRVPDVAVYLQGNPARNCGTHWCGGPDFIVEITSPDDRTRNKLPFYAQIGVRELLLIDRDPWTLELYQLQDGQLLRVGQARLEQPAGLASGVVPLTFRLLSGNPRPLIEVTHRDGVQRWSV